MADTTPVKTSVIPEAMIPGSAKRIEAGVANARSWARYVEHDARPLVRSCRELREVRAWDKWFPDEPKTWERFCKEALGYDAAFLAEIEDGIAILEGRGHDGAIPADQAVDAKRRQVQEQAAELNGKTVNAGDGPLTKEERANRHTMTVTTDNGRRGTSADYLTRRIARDRPDILERMKDGEYKSVRAAALEAGIVKPMIQVPTDNPDRIARLLLKHLAPEQVAALVAALITGTAEG